MENVQVLTLAFVVFLNFIHLRAVELDINKIDHRQLEVQISNGKLRGSFHGYYYAYESIPYAKPPVGELRFEPPLPYTTKWEKIRDATQKADYCMQWDQFNRIGGVDLLSGVEDCLTLSVYKPVVTNNLTLPVLVYIHGGGFMYGKAELGSHERIMRQGGFIVVKMNYRLGPLGFLSTEDDVIPGNYGLKDQRLALQWIKSNIACFGGDPERILVLGFSAGGASVHLHMLHGDLANYAKVAVSLSGTAFNPWVVLQNSRERAMFMAKNLNCPNWNNSLEIKRCLKSKPASEIVRGVQYTHVFGYNPFTTFGPVVEGADVKDAFLTQPPEDIVRSGKFSHMPWLTAYTSEDGGFNAAELLTIRPRRGEMIEELNDRWFDVAPYALFYKDTMTSVEQMDDYSLALKNRYLRNREFAVDTYLDVQRMYTDVLFKNPIEKSLRLHREFSKSPVYAYVYDNPTEKISGTVPKALCRRTDISYGTTHGDDFFLLFPSPFIPENTTETSERNLFNNFIKMMEDFVDNGNELTYGDCKFVDNVGQTEFQLTKINKTSCENLIVKNFP